MRRITYVLSAASLAALLFTPPAAQAQSQDIDNLRRRVEDVERQIFQQRLSTPLNQQDQSLERLQMRLDHLEQRLASERISRVAADVTASNRASAPAALDTFDARLHELEQARAAGAKMIEKLTARIEALEKAAAKPPVRRRSE